MSENWEVRECTFGRSGTVAWETRTAQRGDGSQWRKRPLDTWKRKMSECECVRVCALWGKGGECGNWCHLLRFFRESTFQWCFWCHRQCDLWKPNAVPAHADIAPERDAGEGGEEEEGENRLALSLTPFTWYTFQKKSHICVDISSTQTLAYAHLLHNQVDEVIARFGCAFTAFRQCAKVPIIGHIWEHGHGSGSDSVPEKVDVLRLTRAGGEVVIAKLKGNESSLGLENK